jgi:hypothetical protein
MNLATSITPELAKRLVLLAYKETCPTDHPLLAAKCVFCGYNGQNYWQGGTHNENCPWYTVGGAHERMQALPGVMADLMRTQSARREHIVQIGAVQVDQLLTWLQAPNGSCSLGDRLTVEAVVDGGLLVRTRSWEPPK